LINARASRQSAASIPELEDGSSRFLAQPVAPARKSIICDYAGLTSAIVLVTKTLQNAKMDATIRQ